VISGARIIADLKVTARGFLRSRVGVFFSLIFPVILILLFGAIFSGGSGPVTAYVQNNDQTCHQGVPVCVSTELIAALNSTKALTLIPVPTSANFTQYLLSHSSSDGLIIPTNFTSQFLAGAKVNITLYGNPASTTSAIVSGVTNEVVNAFNLQAVRLTLPEVQKIPTIGVSGTTIKSTGTKEIDFLIPGLIGFAVLISPMFAMVNISSQYKRDKLFKQLSLTPLTKAEWLLSRILWYILVTFGAFTLLTLAGVYLFGAHVALSVYIIPFLLLGPFLFVSLGMLVGTVSNSPESAAVVGNLITFPMMFLSGTFFPVSTMPQFLQSFAHVLPLYYIIEGLTNVMTYGNFGAATTDLGIVFVIAVVIFYLAIRFFKWRED